MEGGADAGGDEVLGALRLEHKRHMVRDEPQRAVRLEDLAARHMVVVPLRRHDDGNLGWLPNAMFAPPFFSL